MSNTLKCTKPQLIECLDKHLDDCPCDYYEGVNDGEIIFILDNKEEN